jgi:S-ribosylhomocysteine lyase
MDKIASFTVDHTKLKKGLYISRIDGDITTFDLRMRLPNSEPVMENAPLHTIEHLGATYLRNSQYKNGIIYFGPMGCRTGFYLLTRDISNKDVIGLLQDVFACITKFEGDISGASAAECGNWQDHDLQLAKTYARDYAEILKDITEDNLIY